MEEKSRVTGKLRVVIPGIVLAIGIIIGLYYGINYWLYNLKHVVTDDARIKGRMVSVSPTVSGVVKVLYVDEGAFGERHPLVTNPIVIATNPAPKAAFRSRPPVARARPATNRKSSTRISSTSRPTVSQSTFIPRNLQKHAF